MTVFDYLNRLASSKSIKIIKGGRQETMAPNSFLCLNNNILFILPQHTKWMNSVGASATAFLKDVVTVNGTQCSFQWLTKHILLFLSFLKGSTYMCN